MKSEYIITTLVIVNFGIYEASIFFHQIPALIVDMGVGFLAGVAFSACIKSIKEQRELDRKIKQFKEQNDKN